MLMDENLSRVSFLRPGAGVQSDLFRRERLYCEEVNNCFQVGTQHVQILAKQSDHWCGQQTPFTLPCRRALATGGVQNHPFPCLCTSAESP
eukprot:6845534-Pyramimonas_sp.AAC.1